MECLIELNSCTRAQNSKSWWTALWELSPGLQISLSKPYMVPVCIYARLESQVLLLPHAYSGAGHRRTSHGVPTAETHSAHTGCSPSAHKSEARPEDPVGLHTATQTCTPVWKLHFPWLLPSSSPGRGAPWISGGRKIGSCSTGGLKEESGGSVGLTGVIHMEK